MSDPRKSVRFGTYELVAATQELWRDGRRVHLTPQAMRILIELTAAPDRLVTREHLRAVLWPDGTHVDFESSLNTAVRKLRAALADDGERPRFVERVPGRGYRFIAPVREVSAPAADAGGDAAAAEAAAAAAAAVPVAVGVAVPPEESQPAARPPRTMMRPAAIAGAIACAVAAVIVATAAISMSISRSISPSISPDVSQVTGDAADTIRAAAFDAYRRGVTAARANRIADLAVAVDALETAVRLNPEFAPAWSALARTRVVRAIRDGRDPGQLTLADMEASRALALDRDQADAYVAIGLVRFARDRDAAGAEAWLLRARALGATSGQDVLWQACVLNAQRRFDEALRLLDGAIAHEPRLAVLHAWRGLMLHSLRRYDEEIVALRYAAAIDPQSPEALFHLGMGYARRRQYDLALPALRRAVALSGEGGYYVSWFGRTAADAGDLAAAEQALRELDVIARTRGLAPALSGAVSYHIDAERHRSGALAAGQS